MKGKNFLKPIKNEPIVDAVIQRITDGVITGELKPGDKIPTEVELCENFGVGRNTIREAIKVLVALGLIEIKRADGTYISSSFSEKMINPLIYYLIMKKDNSIEIVELRRFFEVGVLELAIGKATSEDVKKLEAIHSELTKMATSGKINFEQIAQIEFDFHEEIIRIARNSLIEKIGDIINRLTKPSLIKTVKNIIDTSSVDFIVNIHEEIISLIKNKDYTNIRNVIEKSYSKWKNNVD